MSFVKSNTASYVHNVDNKQLHLRISCICTASLLHQSSGGNHFTVPLLQPSVGCDGQHLQGLQGAMKITLQGQLVTEVLDSAQMGCCS